MVNTKAQFDKAVAIVKGLPEDGPVKPTQEDKLAVSPYASSPLTTVGIQAYISVSVLRPLQAG